MYVLAPRWKGQVLPPGARGYPRSHPNVFSYARPRYVVGRGFVSRGLGQDSSTLTTDTSLNCSLLPGGQGLTNPECGGLPAWLAGLFTSSSGGTAPAAAAPTVPSAAIAPPAPTLTTSGIGTPVLCTSPAGVPNSTPCAAGQVPTAADYAAAGQAISTATLAQLQAAVAAGTPCPGPTTPSGTCCASGQVVDASGNCSTPFSMPWWGWALIAGFAVLLVAR